MAGPANHMPAGAPRWKPALYILCVLIAVGATLWAYTRGWFEIFGDLPALRQIIRSSGAWGPVILIALGAAQTLLAPIPGHALNMVSGYLYGPWLGTFYSLTGMFLGSLVGLFLVRRMGRPLVERLVGRGNMTRIDQLTTHHGPLFLLLIFLLPFLPDDLACLAAGLTPMPIRQITLLLLVGRLPGLFVANWIGWRAAGLTAGQWTAFIVCAIAVALIFWRLQARLERCFMEFASRLSGPKRESRGDTICAPPPHDG